MKVESTGSSKFAKLVSKPQKINTELCIIYQKVRGSIQNIKLTSAPKGRDVVISTHTQRYSHATNWQVLRWDKKQKKLLIHVTQEMHYMQAD